MLRILFLFLFIAWAIPAWAAEPSPVYQVTFKALTAFGDPVAAHVVTLADPLHHRDLASHCTATVCTEIPEGAYSYAITLDGTGRRVEGSAVVYRTNQVVAVDVGMPEADMDDAEFPTIVGKVTGAADTAKIWIRLQQLYSDASVSAHIEKSGSFRLDQVRPGNWMLLVFVDGKLAHFEPFTCKEKENPPLVLKLDDGKPLLKI
jgi:hypothetical protein